MLYWRKFFKYFTGYINHSNCHIRPLLLNGPTKISINVNYMLFMLNEKHKGISKKPRSIEQNQTSH